MCGVMKKRGEGGTRGPSEKAKSIFFECAMIKVSECEWLRF